MKSLIIIILSLAVIVLGSKVVLENASTSTPTEIKVIENNTWKVWQDSTFTKATGAYTTYQLKYPRDFDVYRLDQARGGFLTPSPRVTLAFPEDAFQMPKTNFAEAYVAVSVSGDAKIVNSCFKASDQEALGLTDVRTINGIEFKTGNLSEAASGNIYKSRLYRAIYQDLCYEIVLTVHTGNIHNYPAGEVVEFNNEEAFSVLEEILNTFSVTTDTKPTL